MRICLGIWFCFLAFGSAKAQYAQQYKELEEKTHSPNDTVRMFAYIELADLVMRNDLDEAERLLVEGHGLAKRISHQRGMARAEVGQASLLNYQGKRKEAAETLEKALLAYGENKDIAASIHSHLAALNYYLSDLPKALEHCIKARDLYKEIGDLEGQANSYNTLGGIYYSTGDIQSSLQSFKEALFMYESIPGNKKWTADIRYNLGELYMEFGEPDSAFVHLRRARSIYQQEESTKGMINTARALSAAYAQQGDWKRAFELGKEAVAISDSSGDKPFHADALFHLGKLYCQSQDYHAGKPLLIQSFNLQRELQNGESMISIADAISGEAQRANDLSTALQFLNESVQLRDSLRSVQKDRATADMLVQYQTQRKTDSLELQQQRAELAEKERDQAENDKRLSRNLLIVSLVGIGLCLAMILFVIRTSRLRKRANLLLANQNREITLKNQEIEVKNKDITDSIRYARRIQQSVLPSEAVLKKLLNEHFLFFLPRDIVSGDFFWAEERGDQIWLAVADCTGHGVPGAFMSLLGSQALSKAVMEQRAENPAEALEMMNRIVLEALAGSSGEDRVQDGMDIGLVCMDKQSQTIQFAGANNPLWVIRHGELIELKPDKQPIGYFEYRKAFSNQIFHVQEGDLIYLFSDGYADQFGGKTGKKLKVSHLQALLRRISVLTIPEQHQRIRTHFFDWKGDLEQVDDVCVVGIRM